MNRTIAVFTALALTASFAAVAEQAQEPATQVAATADSQTKTLPPVTAADKNNSNSLSSTLERGMDNHGLTMEEKWADDVIVCKRQQITGSRVKKKVCHSRGEWRAIRENGRELTRLIQRGGSGLDGE